MADAALSDDVTDDDVSCGKAVAQVIFVVANVMIVVATDVVLSYCVAVAKRNGTGDC